MAMHGNRQVWEKFARILTRSVLQYQEMGRVFLRPVLKNTRALEGLEPVFGGPYMELQNAPRKYPGEINHTSPISMHCHALLFKQL